MLGLDRVSLPSEFLKLTSGVSSASFELQKSGETLFGNQNSLDYNGRIMENVFSPDETHRD